MHIEGSLSLSRGSDDKIRISVRDEASNVEFLVAEIDPVDFAMLVTGLAGVKAPCEVRGLDVVGKLKIRESRTVVCPLKLYDRNILEQWVIDNCQEEGWIIDHYLRSQGSIFASEGGAGLRYSVYRYEG